MSNDNSNNVPSADVPRQRRASMSGNPITSLFQRGNSLATGTQVLPGAITTAAMNDHRRRLSISTIGLGTSPTAVPAPFGLRRGSISTNGSDSVIDENAIDDEELPANARTAPTTPFARRMSFGNPAMRNVRGPPGTSPNNDQGFNWSEQLRSRAESIAAGAARPVGLSASPPRGNPVSGGVPPAPQQSTSPGHDRAKSVSDMSAPPVQTPKPRPQKPDHFQERILKGDFYMD
ncbi:hypothetical protein DL546_002482 [Coniochaeta pulveracea]|uniref:Uncharacterized protein n=1 Tax=Coniochaeta pulveracea TaxID=177199 RepID=A0A420Y1G8_9PEZI|nr:hypothetical protein DL546_002482 [Coniochaeta pulveracea]